MKIPLMVSKAMFTRKRIVQESAILFNQKGYAGTSMEDIIKATNLSKGAIYGHFGNKEEIAVAAFEHAVGQVWEQVRIRTRVIDYVPDKLKAVVYFYKERILTPPVEGGCPIQNTSVDADDNNATLRAKVLDALNYWQDRMVLTLNKGIERREIQPIDTRKFAIEFIGSLEGGIMLAQLYKDVKYFNVMADRLIQMVDEVSIR